MLQDERKKQIQKEANDLVTTGTSILLAQTYRIYTKSYKGEVADQLKKLTELYPLQSSYQSWYTKSLPFLSVFGQDRLEEFKSLYQVKSRKEIDVTTYGINDYLQGLSTTHFGEKRTYDGTFQTKFQQQIDIVKSISDRIGTVFDDLFEEIRFDLLQSELEAARALKKAGFQRAGGTLAGVALEAHLATVCQKHGALPKKKDPTLNDLSQALKDANVLDTAQWRFIQHLSDVRNKCAHHKSSEPTPDEVEDLISGVDKVTKTVG